MADRRRVAITTTDNPYDPIDQFEEWYAYDEMKGYRTSEYLARLTHTAKSLSDYLNDADIEAAIDEMVKFNLTGNYIKVVR